MPWGSSRWGSSRWSGTDEFYLALQLASMPSMSRVRVFFNHPVDNDDELNRLTNWTLTPVSYGGVSAQFVSLEHDEGGQVEFIDLLLERELTEAVYRVTVAPGKISDYGYYCLEPFNVASFTATVSRPVVVSATPVSARRIVVLFSEEMDETLSITDPESYKISPTVRVARVARSGKQRVTLELAADMVPDERYQLVVTP